MSAKKLVEAAARAGYNASEDFYRYTNHDRRPRDYDRDAVEIDRAEWAHVGRAVAAEVLRRAADQARTHVRQGEVTAAELCLAHDIADHLCDLADSVEAHRG